MSSDLRRVARSLVLLLLGAGSLLAAQPTGPHAAPDSPQILYRELFVAVQSAQLYPDGKAFVDAVPDASPARILREYRAQHPGTPGALRRFVEAHFRLPSEASETPEPAAAQVDIGTHIDRLWDRLTRTTESAPPWSSLLALPKPYVVPGGRFREMYYWDSYFTMLGLTASGREDLLQDMVQDFAYLIDTYGHVPNGARTYYLSRSQPPFFYAMVGLLDSADPVTSLAHYLPQLKREHAFWMQGAAGLRPGAAHRRVVAMPDGSILNRYWDDRDIPRDESYRLDSELAGASGRDPPQLFRDIRAAAESGWDFSSRWFADGDTLGTIDTTGIVPVDLNSLLFGLEEAIWHACERVRDSECTADYRRRAAARRAAVDRYLWDEQAGAYLDYQRVRNTRVPPVSAATLYPLFVALASERQASAVAATVRSALLKAGGIVTSTRRTGQQWDAPNGWAPLQWLGVAGFDRYHQSELAESIACRWMVNVRRVYEQSGKLVEKYDVIDTERPGGGGEYPLQDGFGWTNGVMRKLMALYPGDATLSRADQCPAAAQKAP